MDDRGALLLGHGANRFHRRAVVRTSRMRHHALEWQPGALQRPRDGDELGRIRCHARAVPIGVDLDQHFELPVPLVGVFADEAGGFDAVQDDRHSRALVLQGRDMVQLVGRNADGVEDVLHTLAGEELGLLERGHGDRPFGRLHHPARHFHALVGLDVRAERDAQPAHLLAHARDVAVHAGLVEEQRRRLQLFEKLRAHIKPAQFRFRAPAPVPDARRWTCPRPTPRRR
jgi:hypothetical protein